MAFPPLPAWSDRLPANTRLEYYVWTETWWYQLLDAGGRRNDEPPHIGIAAQYPGGGVAWHFRVEQHTFTENSRPGQALRLCLFDDSWMALVQIPELFAALGSDDRPADLPSLARLLDSLGILDTTPRTPPDYARARTEPTES